MKFAGIAAAAGIITTVTGAAIPDVKADVAGAKADANKLVSGM